MRRTTANGRRPASWGRARAIRPSSRSASGFTQLRNAPGHEWLQDYSYAIVRYVCKYMGDAYAAFFDPDRPDHGRPQYKAKHYTKPAFTIPSHVRIEDGRLYIPKMGWTRLGPIHRYADGQPLTVRVRQESESKQPKWYAYIVFEVPEDHPDVCRPAGSGAVGVDRNVGQATDSTGALHALPDTTVEDAKIKRYQRRMARQQKGSKRRRGTGGKTAQTPAQTAPDGGTRPHHQISRKVADTAHTVVMEDLNTKAMTKSAKGTVEKPGRNVKQKSGLKPCHPGVRLGTVGAQARVQGRPGGVCGPGLHFAIL